MQNVWALASLWVGLALVATLLAIWFKISRALTEIVVGTVAQLFIDALVGPVGLGAKSEWITFLAGTGAIVLTFLAGAELDRAIFRTRWKEAMVAGLVGFFGPFLGCTAIAHYVLHWTAKSSWRAGVALSTSSVAVDYAVMLELGLNKTEFGKAILAACFVNDLGTVIAVGHPVEQIVHRAETDRVDLMILGRRGMSRFEKMIVGCKSGKVPRYANCPVMVVR
jgi:glutathione-regulated potassium-efflux system ancillary protein KefC